MRGGRTVKDPASGQSYEQPGLQPMAMTVYLTLLISMFMHGGVAHLGGNIPSLGASGAISGVLGGYRLLFPAGRVRMLVRGGTTEMPAWTSIGLWFVFQLVAGMGMLGGGSQAGGVAYAAHIGGFVAGLILVKAFAAGRPSR